MQILREVWLYYWMFKIGEITGKIDFQFSKLTFSRVGDYLRICLNTSKIPKFQ